jgi:hypothetical protein
MNFWQEDEKTAFINAYKVSSNTRADSMSSTSC